MKHLFKHYYKQLRLYGITDQVFETDKEIHNQVNIKAFNHALDCMLIRGKLETTKIDKYKSRKDYQDKIKQLMIDLELDFKLN